MDATNKAETVNHYKRNEKDTGSPEVQVALLTCRIKELTDHLSSFAKDHSARRGLIMMVNKRRKLLTYLQKQDDGRYKELISKLGLVASAVFFTCRAQFVRHLSVQCKKCRINDNQKGAPFRKFRA